MSNVVQLRPPRRGIVGELKDAMLEYRNKQALKSAQRPKRVMLPCKGWYFWDVMDRPNHTWYEGRCTGCKMKWEDRYGKTRARPGRKPHERVGG